MNSLISWESVTTLCVVLIIATAALLAYVIADRRFIAQLEAKLDDVVTHHDRALGKLEAFQVRVSEAEDELYATKTRLQCKTAQADQLTRDNYAYAVKLADRLKEVNELKRKVSRLQKQQQVQVNELKLKVSQLQEQQRVQVNS